MLFWLQRLNKKSKSQKQYRKLRIKSNKKKTNRRKSNKIKQTKKQKGG